MSSHVVSLTRLRQIFNTSGYPQRADSGNNISVTVVRRGNPAPQYNQPPGTVSETYLYRENRNGRLVVVAKAHAFVLPDGSINNPAGLPDPKYVRIGNDTYKLARKNPKGRRGKGGK